MNPTSKTLSFTHKSEAEVKTWHYWVVVPGSWDRNHALCSRGEMTLNEWGAVNTPCGITTVPADVTCPDCIEWMHA